MDMAEDLVRTSVDKSLENLRRQMEREMEARKLDMMEVSGWKKEWVSDGQKERVSDLKEWVSDLK